MAAKYPEIFVKDSIGLAFDYSNALSDMTQDVITSNDFIRLEDVLLGASFKIEPALQKKMNRGQQRTLSEKISLELKLAFIDRERYNDARRWINHPTDMIWFDPEDRSGMVTIFKDIVLSVKGELEGGDGYIVTLGADHEVRTGAGVIMEDVPDLRLINFFVKDNHEHPVEAVVFVDDVDIIDSTTNVDGYLWVLHNLPLEFIMGREYTVRGTGYLEYEKCSIPCEHFKNPHEHTYHVTLTLIPPPPSPS